MSARRSERLLSLALAAGLFGSGCEASDREIDEHERGDLILSGPNARVYRFDRRVEQVPTERIPPESRPTWAKCGYLTERAAADIDRALAELDPEAKYAVDTQACAHEWSDGSSSKIHIEGFTHSPFICGPPGACCAEELGDLSAFYGRVLEYLGGNGEQIDEILEELGVDAYPMIEPDEPCR